MEINHFKKCQEPTNHRLNNLSGNQWEAHQVKLSNLSGSPSGNLFGNRLRIKFLKDRFGLGTRNLSKKLNSKLIKV